MRGLVAHQPPPEGLEPERARPEGACGAQDPLFPGLLPGLAGGDALD
jgi:hypothetical protein